MKSQLRYYLLGIGGIAMANLACLLKKRGYQISGSDLDTFGPSAELLKNHRINYFKNHDPKNIKKFKPDMVIIGNAIRRGNPTLEYIIRNNIPYQSMPETIKETLLPNKSPIVITGTSGKTTTSALTAWILHHAGLKPTALVGGIMNNFDSGFLNGSGKYVVIEGDEYNSSFQDPSPKFQHYSPYIAVVNNIQADHLDIYGSLSKIVNTFKKLPGLIPKNGLLILNAEDKNSLSLKKLSSARVELFGQGSSVSAERIETSSDGLEFDLIYKNKNMRKVKTSLFGKHNVDNILAATAVAISIGIPFKKISSAIGTFKGVKRRLEIIHDKNGVKIIDDFAHNPDKVSASLSALRQHFPKHKIVAIFEPRTGSSRRKFFQTAYPPSFKLADLVYIAEPYKKSALDKKDALSSKKLAKDINDSGVKAYAKSGADEIILHIKNNFLQNNHSPAIFIVMTSGNFDGIHQKLIDLV